MAAKKPRKPGGRGSDGDSAEQLRIALEQLAKAVTLILGVLAGGTSGVLAEAYDELEVVRRALRRA